MTKKIEIGARFRRYLPWKPDIRTVEVIARRTPEEGEYMMTSVTSTVVQRKGGAFLSKADAEREYWIVKEVDE